MSKERAEKGQEVAVVLGETDHQALVVLGNEQGPQQIGLCHKFHEGQPIHGDVVHLSSRGDGFHNVERISISSGRHGPSQVATKQYRDNYDKIFVKTTDIN